MKFSGESLCVLLMEYVPLTGIQFVRALLREHASVDNRMMEGEFSNIKTHEFPKLATYQRLAPKVYALEARLEQLQRLRLQENASQRLSLRLSHVQGLLHLQAYFRRQVLRRTRRMLAAAWGRHRRMTKAKFFCFARALFPRQ